MGIDPLSSCCWLPCCDLHTALCGASCPGTLGGGSLGLAQLAACCCSQLRLVPALPAFACSLLLLGFVLPTACIFFWELRMRRAVLAQHAAAAAEGTRGGRAASRVLEESEHVPGFVEYCYFAVPALAAMWTFAAA